MDTFFIKLKDSKGSVVEIKRQAKSESDIETLIKEEFPESEIISIKILILD
jgi:hypothetical protein